MTTILPPPPSSRTARVLAFVIPASAPVPRDPSEVPYVEKADRPTWRPKAA